MTDQEYSGFYHQASREWVRRHSHHHFGLAHRDTTLLSWADTFLACSYQSAFLQHILNCIRYVSPPQANQKIPPHSQNDPHFTCRAPATGTHTSNTLNIDSHD
eukprot:8198587-Ditylum_brightwellii.AAC.1